MFEDGQVIQKPEKPTKNDMVALVNGYLQIIYWDEDHGEYREYDWNGETVTIPESLET